MNVFNNKIGLYARYVEAETPANARDTKVNFFLPEVTAVVMLN
jgi:hypothetical protein